MRTWRSLVSTMPRYAAPMDAWTGVSVARHMWTWIETFHAPVYFSKHVIQAFKDAGLKGFWMGYFAGRAAAMGAVNAAVVEATFYNFHPSMVRRAIPDAWSFSTPEEVLAARLRGMHATYEALGPFDEAAIIEAASLACGALDACTIAGRPMFAAQVAQPIPTEPMLELWHACTALREHRGDGHVAALIAHEIDGCEAHVLITAEGTVPVEVITPSRGWPESEWQAAIDRMRTRGLIEAGGLTDAGRELRASIESMTDHLAAQPWDRLGVDGCQRLELLLHEPIDAIIDAGVIPFPNPMGLPKPIRSWPSR
jgi:hypothetical protein